MVSGGEVQPGESSLFQRIRRGIEKAFSPLPAGNVGIGGFSTPITNVLPSAIISESAKEDIAQQERISSGGRVGGGTGGGGISRGGGISGPTPSEIAASTTAAAEAARQAAVARQAAADRARIEAALRTQQALRDVKRDIIARGGTTKTITSREAETGRELEITTTRGSGGRLIREVEDVETGEIKTTEFGPGKGGGGVGFKGGVIIGGGIVEEKVDVKPDVEFKIFDVKPTQQPDEIFIPDMNIFGRPSEPSGQATALFRPPTIKELEDIKSAEERGKIGTIVSGGIGFIESGIEKVREIPIVKSTGEKVVAFGFFQKAEEFVERLDERRQQMDIRRGDPGFFETKAQIFTTPEGVRSIFGLGAEATLKGGEFLSEGLAKTQIFLGADPKVVREKAPVTRKGAKELLTDVLIFSAFSPLIKTATAQQTQVFADEVVEVIVNGKRVRMLLSEARRRGLDPMTRLQAETSFKALSQERQIEILKIAFKKEFKDVLFLDAGTQQAEILKAIIKARRFMRSAGLTEAETTANINILFPGMAQQQTSTVLIAESVGREAPVVTKVTQSVGVQITQLEQLPQVLTGVSMFDTTRLQPSTVGQLQPSAVGQLFTQDFKQDIKQDQRQVQLLGFDTTQATTQRQPPKQDTKQGQIPLLDFGISQIPKQPTPQRQEFFQPQRPSPPRQKPPRPQKPIKPIKPTSLVKRLTKKVEEGELFEIFTRKGGKDIKVAKAETEAEAFKKLKKKLKGTLRASGFVEKGGKKVSPPLFLNGEFRKSKVDPFRVVEKKAKRLRKGTTGKEVQMFRAFGVGKKKKKSKGFFGF